MAFIQSNWEMIVMALLAFSELLALFPKVKANSIFQLVVNCLKSMAPGKKTGVVVAEEKGKLKK